MGLVSHGNDRQHSPPTDFLPSAKCHPCFISCLQSFFFHLLPQPCSPSLCCVHLGVVPVLRCAAEVYNLPRLLVWLHLASSTALYFFCRNSKLGCAPCLSLCHRCSLSCKIKANRSACNHLHGRQRFWQKTQVRLKEKADNTERSCRTV